MKNEKHLNIELPKWLQDELPEKKPIQTITWSAEHSGFYIKESESPTYYSDAYDLYRVIQQNSNVDCMLDDSINGKNGVEGDKHFASVNNKLMIVSTDEDKEHLLKMDYYHWVNNIHVDYINNPNDHFVAYNWLVHHPVFWWRNTPNKTFTWNTDSGLLQSYVYITNHKNKPMVIIEVGEHTTDYTAHYHNVDLDTSARSFDKLYVKLAARINKLFNYDGSPVETL